MISFKLIRSVGWAMVLTVVVLSLVPLPDVPNSVPNSDKWLHFTTYFILTYWFLHSYYKKPIPITVGFVLLGTLLECLQALTVYRYWEWLDLVMNISGVLLALLLCNVLNLRVKFLIVD